jgi:hypothetical protein
MSSNLVAVWVLSWISILIMCVRLFLGRWYKKKFDMGDALTVAAIFFTLARIPFAHIVVLWRTNNISPSSGDIQKLSNDEIRHREIGGKFTLVQRCLYITV